MQTHPHTPTHDQPNLGIDISFQFAFNYLKDDCVEVLSEWIPNVKENAKATSLVFVLLDFSMRVLEEERSVQEFRHVAVLRSRQDQNCLQHRNTYKRLYP